MTGKIDWFGFAERFQDMIASNLDIVATIEEARPAGIDSNPSVSIFIKGREVPEDRQVIAAFTVTRYLVSIEMWVVAFSIDGVKDAINLRDDTIGDIEQLLQTSSNWSSFADAIYLDGGEFETGQDMESRVGGYYAAGSINFRVDVTHTL